MNLSSVAPTSKSFLPEVFGCLERGGTVVAANARAARALRLAYDAQQRALGKSAWQTPLVYDWESWLGVLWKQYLLAASDAPLLLTPLQERSVWKRIIGAEAGEPESVAMLAAGAWKLLSSFGVHMEHQHAWHGRSTTDAEVFRAWSEAFERECRRNRLLSRSDLPVLFTNAIERSLLALPSELLLVGFDRFVPAQQHWITAARAAGCEARVLALEGTPGTMQLVRADDLSDELATCAWWARRRLEQNPAARIAILVQDIEEKRGEIERTFRRILLPESIGIENHEALPIEFSLGRPLAAVPIIKAALLLLRWMLVPLEQSAISWLLLCGFLTADEDLTEMALLDAEIRKRGQFPPEVPLAALAAFQPRSPSGAKMRFLRRARDVVRMVQVEGHLQRKQPVPEWLEFAASSLRQMGWPGVRALDSIEFQALIRWEKLTTDMGALGFDGSRCTALQFEQMIDRYANETIFSPESQLYPIQISGALESAGQHFDAVWFVGADDRQWPGLSHPHPLLTWALQRQAAMPHSSLEVDWQSGLAVMHRIGASAPECIFSYTGRDNAGEVRPSALLFEAFGDSPIRVSSEQMQSTLCVPAVQPHRCTTLENAEDSSVPWAREVEAGGSDILKRQSACAFQSFAMRRLGAAELDVSERGLSPRDRGNLLHEVLEAIWSPGSAPHLRLQNRQDLISARTGGRISSMLREHIRQVFIKYGRDRTSSIWSKQYLQLEQERLHSLLLQWLEYESQREDFSVQETERQFHVEINGLRLDLRADRIDQVDGGYVVLDYKTGSVSPSRWDGDRPEEPQLPLYGVYKLGHSLRGILFAQIRAGDMCLNGRAFDVTKTVTNRASKHSELVRNPLTDEMLGSWADALSQLADQFLAGEAAVAPKRYPKTCSYCALGALCRIAETSPTCEPEDLDREPSDDTAVAASAADD